MHVLGMARCSSVVLGNCNFGFAPVKPEFRKRSMLTMTRNEAIAIIIRVAGGNFRLLNCLLTQIPRILEINTSRK